MQDIFENYIQSVSAKFSHKRIDHDARVAEKNGKIDLVYSFINRKYLVITNSN